jgi:hypothetical protein
MLVCAIMVNKERVSGGRGPPAARVEPPAAVGFDVGYSHLNAAARGGGQRGGKTKQVAPERNRRDRQALERQLLPDCRILLNRHDRASRQINGDR